MTNVRPTKARVTKPMWSQTKNSRRTEKTTINRRRGKNPSLNEPVGDRGHDRNPSPSQRRLPTNRRMWRYPTRPKSIPSQKQMQKQMQMRTQKMSPNPRRHLRLLFLPRSLNARDVR
jgi:hypothetical protein